ncbi:hypothetical protein [Streptomyces bohaiensis]|uniref:Lipoprotein n=1 Tax=Streptomyces bohaiensis TaxID=1431344 RepID=A0ABX1CFA7_9ACTN|nr:hypothetical protein [Streptomyces bohaiensis]NJQ16092.1 hypothetical protein [Streptomyces bohaiensis]
MALRGARLLAAAVIGGAALLTGCGGTTGPEAGPDGTVDDPLAAGPESPVEEGPAAELRRAVNESMATTTFRAAGPSPAFPDAQQVMWSDPEVGVRVALTSETSDGEMFCQDGVVYTSVPLFAARMAQSGDPVDVPPQVLDGFVSVQVGDDCGALFEVPPGARFAPELDTVVAGAEATALVTSGGGVTETFLAAAEAPHHLLRLESEFADGGGTTVYDSFGDPVDIRMPDEAKVMSTEEFFNLVQPG